MFAPELSDDELEALMKGQKTETSNDVLGNNDNLGEEDDTLLVFFLLDQ